MKPLLLCAALAVGTAVYAGPSFERVIGGADLDRGIFVTPTGDGGYVAVGYTRSMGAGDEDVYLVKTDAEGRVLWSRAHGGPRADNGWSVQEHAGGLIVAGFTESFGAGDNDCYLIATDLEGHLRWSRTFGGEGRDRCWGLLPTPDGGLVLVGETTSMGAGAEDCYLIKTDASGGEEWSRTFGGVRGDRCFAVAQAADGGFLLAGQTYSEGAGDRDAYVIRTDPSGRRLWSKTFGGAVSDVAHAVARTAEGDFLVTGYTTSLAVEEDDPYIIRIDAGGNVRWTRVLPMPGVNRTLTGEQTADGGFVLGGFSEHRATGSRGALLVETDAAGAVAWSRELFPTTTGQSMGYTVRATSDGGSVLTGHTTEGGAGDLDLFVVKRDAEGR